MAETEFSLVRFHGDTARAGAVYSGMQPLTGEDIADTVHWITSRPARVNVNTISLMPSTQAFAGFSIKRE
jgi:NADP-dependent 3-hydroxy acid dehydrogenase YdfG